MPATFDQVQNPHLLKYLSEFVKALIDHSYTLSYGLLFLNENFSSLSQRH